MIDPSVLPLLGQLWLSPLKGQTERGYGTGLQNGAEAAFEEMRAR